MQTTLESPATEKKVEKKDLDLAFKAASTFKARAFVMNIRLCFLSCCSLR